MDKVYNRSQTKTALKPDPMGRHIYLYSLYEGVPPPPRDWTKLSDLNFGWLESEKQFFIFVSFKTLRRRRSKERIIALSLCYVNSTEYSVVVLRLSRDISTPAFTTRVQKSDLSHLGDLVSLFNSP